MISENTRLSVDWGTKEFWESAADLKGPGTFSQAPRGRAEEEPNVSPLATHGTVTPAAAPASPHPIHLWIEGIQVYRAHSGCIDDD